MYFHFFSFLNLAILLWLRARKSLNTHVFLQKTAPKSGKGGLQLFRIYSAPPTGLTIWKEKSTPLEKTPGLANILAAPESLGSDSKIMKIQYFHFFENLAGIVFSSESTKKIDYF